MGWAGLGREGGGCRPERSQPSIGIICVIQIPGCTAKTGCVNLRHIFQQPSTNIHSSVLASPPELHGSVATSHTYNYTCQVVEDSGLLISSIR